MQDNFKQIYKEAEKKTKEQQKSTDVVSGGVHNMEIAHDIQEIRLLTHFSLRSYTLTEYGIFIQGSTRDSLLLEIGYIGGNGVNEAYKFRVQEGLSEGIKNMFIPNSSVLTVSLINESDALYVEELHITANLIYN